ncbi:MAG TPA: DUF4350 domain-containing protein [Dermatophilaceae bacterium]
MTTPTAPGAGATMLRASQPAPPQNLSELGKAFRRKRPRWVTPLVLVGVLLAMAMALTLLDRGGRGNTDDLDPANPGSSGAQALAHVLDGHGVKMTVVRSQRELLSQRVDATSTVVITHTIRLSARTARTALAHAASAARLVLMDPDPEVTRGMGLPIDSHLTDLTRPAAACTGTDLGRDFRLARAGRAYTATGTGTGATTCFPDKRDGGGAMISLPGVTGRPPVVLLGDDTLISNGTILDSDNAAIALHLLGPTGRLIWYIPSLADITASESTSRSIAPSWFQPGLAMGASAVLLLTLWRGRRLGRLVTEPLPVIVRAIETTESRGRMYRRSHDRARALAVLQLATRRRLTAYLGLSSTSSISSVAAAAAAVSGRSYKDVLTLLSSTAVYDDSSLLERANTLAALEKEVRRT